MDYGQRRKAPAVLIVCRDQHKSDMLKTLLYADGYRVSTADTADEGMAMLQKHAFDVFIVDYLLPGIDGLKFMKLIHPSIPSSVKMLIVDMQHQEVVKDARNWGVHLIVDRNFPIDRIKEEICRHLQDESVPHPQPGEQGF
ncbi:MAG: response regulator [Desulfobacterales bacterium]